LLRNIPLNIQLPQGTKLHNSACLICAWKLMSLIVLEEYVQRMSEKGVLRKSIWALNGRSNRKIEKTL